MKDRLGSSHVTVETWSPEAVKRVYSCNDPATSLCYSQITWQSLIVKWSRQRAQALVRGETRVRCCLGSGREGEEEDRERDALKRSSFRVLYRGFVPQKSNIHRVRKVQPVPLFSAFVYSVVVIPSSTCSPAFPINRASRSCRGLGPLSRRRSSALRRRPPLSIVMVTGTDPRL